jgi:hypothetical protein
MSSKGAELAAAGRVSHMLNRGDGLPLPGLFLCPARGHDGGPGYVCFVILRIDNITPSFSGCPDNRRVRRFDNIRYARKIRVRYDRSAVDGRISMSFDDVSLKIVCGFMPKPGKIQSDGSGGLYEPLFRAAYFRYGKGTHGYLYQNPASR